MKIVYHRLFLKHYKKRIFPDSKLRSRFSDRLKLWEQDRKNPVLKDHQLSGIKAEFRSFWINGDVRVVYKPVENDTFEFYDVGRHNQVY